MMLDIRDLSFAYPAGPALFSRLSMQAEGGQTIAIVGRNGAGKSTFLKLLNGILRPLSGDIRIAGTSTLPLKISEIAHHIGTLFQTPEQQLFAPTVRDEVAFGPRQFRLQPHETERRTASALARCGLDHLQTHHPLDLETASRRFLTLASILANEPSILLLDEPQRGLDRPGVERLNTIITEERNKGHLVILVCHDMNFVWQNASAVLATGSDTPPQLYPVETFFDQTALVRAACVDLPAALQLRQSLHASVTA